MKRFLLIFFFLSLGYYALNAQNKNQESIQEEANFSAQIDQWFAPKVKWLGDILFWDPFSAMGIYDPVIYQENGSPYIAVDGEMICHEDHTPFVVSETQTIIEDESSVYLIDKNTKIYHKNGDIYTMHPLWINSDGFIEAKKVERHFPLIVVWLILGAIYFTIRMKFINIRAFKHGLELVQGKYDNPNDPGEVSHFQALATALSGTVGLGNIAGVAIAITVGGPGATFWMIVAGLLGMSLKFTEVTLGVKYREMDKDGNVSGGPMYYLRNGLRLKNLGKMNLGGLGKVLAVIYASILIGASLGGGNMFQSNQTFQQFEMIIPGLEGMGAYFGLGMALLVGVVIIGGIKSIAKITEKIVPFMATFYVLSALVIIGMHFTEIPSVFKMIFDGAFAPDALYGGFIGVLIVGFQRASFSNEAGVGSASIAHSAVKTDEPVSEGIVALMEPVVDTVIVCTMTALVIIFTGFHDPAMAHGLDGAQLTSKAFGSIFSWFPWLLAIAIALFAFSTMISWSYYGLKSFRFLFGDAIDKMFGNPNAKRYIFFAIYLVFVVIGAASSMGSVMDFADMMILSMAFPNIIGLLIMAPEVYRDMVSYMQRVKNGEIKKYR
ncbi:MAG: alanine:cation symporter family protein [Bacteroidales bacterium]|nr:alanine:cation symporter family protein [Bacteroidales bacterium]